MKHASLFSGIGGFDLAAEWMGWDNVFQVEINPFCQKVLEKNFPSVIRYGDIKEFDGTKYRGAIDVLSGGFPCQSFSLAGKGAVDLSLWKEMFRCIHIIRPKVVVAENVYGILARKKGMALTTVCTDLESEGYQTMPPIIIPAVAINAPHRRDRVWIVAYANSNDAGGCKYAEIGCKALESEGTKEKRKWIRPIPERTLQERSFANAESEGLLKGRIRSRDEKELPKLDNHNGKYDWRSFPTQSPICRGDDGIPNRVDRVKSLGNAIVPQVAFEIFKAIASLENLNQNA
jgi:DNA (cytosine-5)-methyltransferase 1